MEKVFAWTTPEEAEQEEIRYWSERSVEERVSAVETLREATLGIYDETPTRLERVYWLFERTPGQVPDRGSPRSGGER